MTTMQLTLSETEQTSLTMLAQLTGKSMNDLLHEAIRTMLQQPTRNDRRLLLRQARGIWKDRSDLPSLTTLRQEFDARIFEHAGQKEERG